jgi:hypothetical protein
MEAEWKRVWPRPWLKLAGGATVSWLVALSPPSPAKAVKLELLVPLGDGLFEVPSPALLGVAEELVRNGISVRAALALVEDLRRHSRVAEAVLAVFRQTLSDEVEHAFGDITRRLSGGTR